LLDDPVPVPVPNPVQVIDLTEDDQPPQAPVRYNVLDQSLSEKSYIAEFMEHIMDEERCTTFLISSLNFQLQDIVNYLKKLLSLPGGCCNNCHRVLIKKVLHLRKELLREVENPADINPWFEAAVMDEGTTYFAGAEVLAMDNSKFQNVKLGLNLKLSTKVPKVTKCTCANVMTCEHPKYFSYPAPIGLIECKHVLELNQGGTAKVLLFIWGKQLGPQRPLGSLHMLFGRNWKGIQKRKETIKRRCVITKGFIYKVMLLALEKQGGGVLKMNELISCCNKLFSCRLLKKKATDPAVRGYVDIDKDFFWEFYPSILNAIVREREMVKSISIDN